MAGTLTVDTIQSDSSYASTVNVASKINFSGSMQIGGQDATFGGMRNRIINGAMTIDQRNSGSSTTTGETYCLDRWYTQNNPTAGTVTTQQVIDAPAGFYNSAKKTFTSVSYNSTSGYTNFQQSIEVQNLLDLAYGTASASSVTVSFWVKSSVTGNHSFAIQNYASSRRSYLTSYTINSANTWEYKSITIPGDTSFALSSTLTNAGLQVRFSQGAGTQYTSSTANSWQTADYFFLSGCVTPATTNGATWQVTGVQLEKGSTATAFESRSYGHELGLCHRYYWQELNSLFASGIAFDTVEAHVRVQYPVPMRTSPTVTIYDNSNNAARIHRNRVGDHGNAATLINATAFGFPGISSSGLTAGGGYACKVKADAEL
jgi:hypothetical protein